MLTLACYQTWSPLHFNYPLFIAIQIWRLRTCTECPKQLLELNRKLIMTQAYWELQALELIRMHNTAIAVQNWLKQTFFRWGQGWPGRLAKSLGHWHRNSHLASYQQPILVCFDPDHNLSPASPTQCFNMAEANANPNRGVGGSNNTHMGGDEGDARWQTFTNNIWPTGCSRIFSHLAVRPLFFLFFLTV